MSKFEIEERRSNTAEIDHSIGNLIDSENTNSRPVFARTLSQIAAWLPSMEILNSSVSITNPNSRNETYTESKREGSSSQEREELISTRNATASDIVGLKIDVTRDNKNQPQRLDIEVTLSGGKSAKLPLVRNGQSWAIEGFDKMSEERRESVLKSLEHGGIRPDDKGIFAGKFSMVEQNDTCLAVKYTEKNDKVDRITYLLPNGTTWIANGKTFELQIKGRDGQEKLFWDGSRNGETFEQSLDERLKGRQTPPIRRTSPSENRSADLIEGHSII